MPLKYRTRLLNEIVCNWLFSFKNEIIIILSFFFLVHCSAGVGRTGVAILTDILLYCVDHNVDIDIPKMLTHLRQQRMLMVQTVAQYKFVHTALIAYLKQSRLI